MAEPIYDPLKEYDQVFRDRFKQVAEQTFADLAQAASVDVEANRNTCATIYDVQGNKKEVDNQISMWNMLLVGLVVLVLGIGVFMYYTYSNSGFRPNGTINPVNFFAGGLLVLGLAIFGAVKINRKRNDLREESEILASQAETLTRQAWQQMQPLNRLFDWDVLARMITQTMPQVVFDPYFSTRRVADLKRIYQWDEEDNEDSSVIFVHSGQINGNPFVLCRSLNMEWGTKVYRGSKTISWTTHERGADGKMQTVHHSETLYAYVEAPCPEYFESTRLIYGNTAAPDLVFDRMPNGLAGEEGSLRYRFNRRKLRKKARNLENSDYAMLTNEEFEVAFDTSNRNNNQQFALLFTPMAQASMLNLLKDKTNGYGDDFNFYKDHMINTIVPDHLQDIALDMNPANYYSFDFDHSKRNFVVFNNELFRAIYFTFAPLLCVPLYQQHRPHHDIYGRNMQLQSAAWEHEAQANFWGQQRFRHAKCETPSILKTTEVERSGSKVKVKVAAHGFYTEQRLTYVRRRGGDGRTHQVPVYWDEYMPITGKGSLTLCEDPGFDDVACSVASRADYIEKFLVDNQLQHYRKHMASKCK